MEYIIHLIVLGMIYLIVAMGLSVIASHTKLLSLATAAFMGVGAYSTAILVTRYHCSFEVVFLLSMLFSGMIAFLVSAIALRTYEEYFIISTIGIQVVIYTMLNNMEWLTNGPFGIGGITNIAIMGIPVNKYWRFALLVGLVTAVIGVIYTMYVNGRIKKLLVAIGVDEIYTKSLGNDVEGVKKVSFVVSSVIIAVGGVLYACYTSYVEPRMFMLDESLLFLIIVVMSGGAKLRILVLSVAIMVILPELLRYIVVSGEYTANIRQILFGVIYMIVVYTRVRRDYELSG